MADDSKSLEERLEEARGKERYHRALPLGGKSAAAGRGYMDPTISKKDAEAAYDKLQNLREEEVEVLAKRAGKDKNPYEDTRRGSEKLRRFAKGGGVTRADGCVTKGHTRGRMV